MQTQFHPGNHIILVSERPSFPQEEERILDFWTKNDCFQEQLKRTKDLPKYTFYDGPPFATGTPHYGHLTAGTIKDIACRYAAMNGKFVDRRFGWDTHGLPVEYEIDKQFNLRFKEDYEKMGIKEYNAHCRSIVMRYSKQWEQTINRMGRWIDFERDYKTLDLNFMESVWWVFKQLFEKGLVYRGCKIMPYSTVCSTVLSNFEANLNYKEVSDPSIYVTFPLLGQEDVKFLAWTTTPWTLPSNLALAVNPEFEYVKIKDIAREQVFIMAKCRLEDFYASKDKSKKYEIIETFTGEKLVGTEYVPIFDYFQERRNDGCFRIVAASFVTSDAGTGVVHCAPGYGADDYKTCVKQGMIRPEQFFQVSNPVQPLDSSGRFTAQVKDYEGQFCKEADSNIKKDLKKRGRLVHETQIKHSYPFCWRSESPLIYKAHNSWFISVTSIKEDLVKNNKKAYWVPAFAQEKRFNNWLENAEDWCFSRSRYWGNPIPLWVSDDFEEVVCVGSIQELKDLTGATEIIDLHRDYIDHLTIPSKQGKGVLKRIDEVFDCWFESGAMPYAQVHYPFSMSEEEFMKIYPADFIGEGIDQTRGWFYTLNVLGTALFNMNPYKNLIVNGLVLAQDGKKMSKRLKNYPDPNDVIEKYGADSIRVYLANSPLVRAETLNFKEDGVKAVIRDVMLPWYNAYRFLIQNIQRYENETQQKFQYSPQKQVSNYMDQWIQTSCQNLIFLVRTEMEKYRLYTVVPKVLSFLENLTNWYVRLNRNRLKGEISESDWLCALNVLFEVILNANVLIAPYAPFLTDNMYQNMKMCMSEQELSVHYCQIPIVTELSNDVQIEKTVSTMQKIIEMGRKMREQKNLNLKQPLNSLQIACKSENQIEEMRKVQSYIESEVNVGEVRITSGFQEFVTFSCLPNLQKLGKRLGKDMGKVTQKIKNLSAEEIESFNTDGTITIEGFQLDSEDIIIKGNYNNLSANLMVDGESDFCVILDTNQNDDLKHKGNAREIVNRVQKLRKEAKLQQQDDIAVFVEVKGQGLEMAIEKEISLIRETVKKPVFCMTNWQKQFQQIIESQFEIEGETLIIRITHNTIRLDGSSIISKYADQYSSIETLVGYYNNQQLQSIQKNGRILFQLDGKQIVLEEQIDYFTK